MSSLKTLDIYAIKQKVNQPGQSTTKRVAIKKLKILEKCNFKCVTCGSTRNLTIAHIVPIRKSHRNHCDFKLDNCKIQCVDCHTISHKRKP